MAPELVCVTWQEHDSITGRATEPQIAHHSTAEPLLWGWYTAAASGRAIIIGHNLPYDEAVIAERYPKLIPLIFAAHDADAVTDTLIRSQLIDIALGRYAKGSRGKGFYTLETQTKRHAGIELQKDEWRLSYGKFIDTPLERWIERAKEVQAEARVRLAELEGRVVSADEQKDHGKHISDLRSMVTSDPRRCLWYPLEDARGTLSLFLAQEEKYSAYLADQYRQTRAAFALHLSSTWGIRTDARGVEILRQETQTEHDECEVELIEAGLVRSNGTRDTKAAKARMIMICRRDGLEFPRTDSHPDPTDRKAQLLTWAERQALGLKAKCKAQDGAPLDDGDPRCCEHICLDEEACDDTEDPILIRYAELSKLKKVLSNDIAALTKGVTYPLHTRYGLAETGRSTSSGPPLQNWARGRKCKACDGKGEVAS